MASRVTRVALKDYRSIAWCDVELQPLTLLVGLNGSGKSNFLDALRFVAEAMYGPLDQVAKVRDGLPSILRKLPKSRSAASFSIQLGFQLDDGRTGEYSLKIGAGADDGLVVEEERCIVDGQGFTSAPPKLTTYIDPGKGWGQTGESRYANVVVMRPNRPSLVAYGTLPFLAPVLNLLTGFTFYLPNPEKMRFPAAIGPGHVLARDDRMPRTSSRESNGTAPTSRLGSKTISAYSIPSSRTSQWRMRTTTDGWHLLRSRIRAIGR